ncbi:MAG: RNA methyltransferase [Actinomycetota bacterium]|nr:RNA methyltransferase [Actinomycetota bacterium]
MVPPGEPVRSARNRRVAEAVRLHRAAGRREAGLTLLEGPHLLLEAVRAGADVRLVFALPGDEEAENLARRAGSELVPVTRRVLHRLAPTEHPRGPVAVMAIPMPVPSGHGRLGDELLVLWGVGDPGNVGTLIRTAAAFGMTVVAGPGTADLWSPKVLRAAAGGHFRTPMGRGRSIEELRSQHHRLVATVPEGGVPPWEADLGARPALLVGDEAQGLAQEVVEAADLRVTIPMPGGTESVNAAVAGSVLAYEVLRRRLSGPQPIPPLAIEGRD